MARFFPSHASFSFTRFPSKILLRDRLYLDVPFYAHYFDFEINGNRIRLGEFENFLHGKSDVGEGMSIGFTVGDGDAARKVVVKINNGGICEYALQSASDDILYGLKPNTEDYLGDMLRPYRARELLLNPKSDVVAKAIKSALSILRESVRGFSTKNPRAKTAKLLKEWILKPTFPAEKNRLELVVALADKFAIPRASLVEFPPKVKRQLYRGLLNEDGHWVTNDLKRVEIPATVPDATPPQWPLTLKQALEKEITRALLDSAFGELESARVMDDWIISHALRNIVFCGPHREALEMNSLFPPSMIQQEAVSVDRIGGWAFNDDAVTYLNRWLGELGSREAWYELQVENNRFDEAGKAGIKLQLKDKKRDIFVSLHEVGSGISQMLPVLLTAVGYRGSLVCIKQPELHLHPALQAELADVFIENRESDKAEGGNRFLIETHSEHLLLRILRRIRQTRKGEAEPGKAISADDVAVLYVENRGDHSIVRNMPISPDGELLHDWPGGFFEEGLREVLY